MESSAALVIVTHECAQYIVTGMARAGAMIAWGIPCYQWNICIDGLDTIQCKNYKKLTVQLELF